MTHHFSIFLFVLLTGCAAPQQGPPTITPPAFVKAAVAGADTNSPAGFRVTISSGQAFTVFCQSSNEWMQVSPDLKNWINFLQLTANVTLAWDASINPVVESYNIYYGTVSGVYTNEINVPGINSTNVTIAGLIEGTAYYFAATTYVKPGWESPFSNEVAYTVPIMAPQLNIK